jgi:hypothetical protein
VTIPAGARRDQGFAQLCDLAEPDTLVGSIGEAGAKRAGDLRQLHEPPELASALNCGHPLYYTTLSRVHRRFGNTNMKA